MNAKIAVVMLSGLLFACVQAPPPEAAAPASPPPMAQAAPPPAPMPQTAELPPERVVTVRSATCERFMELQDDDREAATMFYVGYQASRFKSRTISVGSIPEIAAMATSYCAANPGRPVAQAFASSYAGYLRFHQ